MYLVAEGATNKSAHNTSTTGTLPVSIVIITIPAALIINDGDPKHYTP
jgi:hypothetical protein